MELTTHAPPSFCVGCSSAYFLLRALHIILAADILDCEVEFAFVTLMSKYAF